jgi:hypothetical protein
MFETTEVRRLANGSIDLDHYSKIGKNLHASAIWEACAVVIMHLRRPPKQGDRALEVVPAE